MLRLIFLDAQYCLSSWCRTLILLIQVTFSASSPGMGSHRLPDDQPIFDQLPDLLAGVGIGDFIGLIGVQPGLIFATAKDSGGKPLLKPEHTHGHGRSGKRKVKPF
uniref:Uncharacterized protein n=1 Tax=Capra hircus TaxID=9925 RepID=A0A8C2NRH3_CAPHI